MALVTTIDINPGEEGKENFTIFFVEWSGEVPDSNIPSSL